MVSTDPPRTALLPGVRSSLLATAGGPGALHRSGVSVGQSGGPSGGTPAGVDHELLEGLGVTRAEPKTRDPAAQRRERRRRRLLKEEKGARFHSILLRIGGRTTTLGHQLFIVHRIVSSPELVGASAKVGAVFDHLGLYQEDFRTVDAVAAMVNDGSHDGVAMNLLLTSSEFLRVLEEGTKRESATAWTGFRKLTAADDEEEMDEEGDPTSRTLRVRCMRLLSAINTLNELFEMFDPDMHDKLSVSVVESLCESVGDLGRSIVDEMYAYIDEQETMGINVEGVDRIAFFSHFLRATGIMDDAANADEARAVAEVANANPGVVVMEAFHYQYHPLTRRMVEIVRSMVGDALIAIETRNPEQALAVWKRDKQVDDLYHTILRGLQEEMQRHPEAVESATHFVFAAKNFERIADYATSLARTVHYVTTGTPPGKDVLKAHKE